MCMYVCTYIYTYTHIRIYISVAVLAQAPLWLGSEPGREQCQARTTEGARRQHYSIIWYTVL